MTARDASPDRREGDGASPADFAATNVARARVAVVRIDVHQQGRHHREYSRTPMFRYRCQLRRWAAGALFLWWFGVVSGIANACLAPGLPDQVAGESATAAADVMPHHPTAAMGGDPPQAPHYGDAGGASDQDGLPGKTNCEDFCDKSIVSIPPLKPSLDDVRGLGLAPSAILAAPPARPTQPRLVWVPLRDAGGVQSIPIAFLRLTL